jgi:hypothetical protein
VGLLLERLDANIVLGFIGAIAMFVAVMVFINYRRAIEPQEY